LCFGTVLLLYCTLCCLHILFKHEVSFAFLCRTLSHAGRSNLPLFRHDHHDLPSHLWACSVLNVQTLAISYFITSMWVSWLLLMLYWWSL
jgi:hypothetical protein